MTIGQPQGQKESVTTVFGYAWANTDVAFGQKSDVIRILWVGTQTLRVTHTPEQELQHAIERWLQAREHFYGGNDVGVLDDYREADRRLLTTFADGWSGNRDELLSAAFRNFRRFLVESHERCRRTHGFSQNDPLA